MSDLWIARALDGSWADSASSEQGALDKIAAREPDESKRSGYQILAETMANLLTDSIPGIKRGLKQTLVKWDGDGPIPEDAATNPEKYSQISEVIEGGDGIPTRTLYRRD